MKQRIKLAWRKARDLLSVYKAYAREKRRNAELEGLLYDLQQSRMRVEDHNRQLTFINQRLRDEPQIRRAERLLELIDEVLVPAYTGDGSGISSYELKSWKADYRQYLIDADKARYEPGTLRDFASSDPGTLTILKKVR